MAAIMVAPARDLADGLDPFKIAGASISGWVPSIKAPPGSVPRHPHTTRQEERLAIWLEFYGRVKWFQRGDVSPRFVQLHRMVTPWKTPYAIQYEYEGVLHDYWPDYIGPLVTGGLFIAEAGLTDDKSRAEAQAKARAARRLAHMLGGYYWIGTEDTIVDQHYWNLLMLLGRRDTFGTFHEIEPEITRLWQSGDLVSIDDIVAHYGRRWSDDEVDAAAWKIAADAVAAGRLLFDVVNKELTPSEPLSLIAPDVEPFFPPALPEELPLNDDGAVDDDASDGDDAHTSRSFALGAIPGSIYDASQIEDRARREKFIAHLHAVTAVLAGEPVGRVAREAGMSRQNLRYLLQRTKKHGEAALVPYFVYDADNRGLRPEFKELIRALWTSSIRPSVEAVFEDPKLAELAAELSERELDKGGEIVAEPSYDQVYRYIASIAHDPDVARARAGIVHPQRPRMSTKSYVLSIPGAGRVCQVDEAEFDIRVVTKDGVVICHKIFGLALICVATSAILAAVLCLSKPTEEDYMRLIRLAMERKDTLTVAAGCKNKWTCYGKPALILSDRGKIFTSERATEVLVDRLHIVEDIAPPFAPTVKGTVEAIFAWMARKFFHRLPGTTKSTPTHRGAYDTDKEAQAAGITLEVLESYFYRAIVDGYMRESDPLRRGRRYLLWEQAVAKKGIAKFMGSLDALKLLLMKAVNRRNPDTGRYAIDPDKGISFKNKYYVNPNILPGLRVKPIDLYFDRRDIAVLYVFRDGVYQGEVYCPEYAGRRVSIWEADAENSDDRRRKREGDAESRENRREIVRDARKGRKWQQQQAKKMEQQRQLDIQTTDIHPAHVQAALNIIRNDHTQEVAVESPDIPVVPNSNVIPLRRPTIRPIARGGHHD